MLPLYQLHPGLVIRLSEEKLLRAVGVYIEEGLVLYECFALRSTPKIFSRQAFLLKIIEIGWFNNMKYKVGTEKKIKVYMHIKFLIIKKFLSIRKKNSIDKGIFKINTSPKYFRYRVFSTLLCLLRNSLSSCLYLTPLIFTSAYGIRIKEQIKKLRAKIGIKLENKSTKDMPTVINIQNIKFQKLSLFNLSLMKFITARVINSIRSSIAHFDKSYQIIMKLKKAFIAWLLLLVVFLSNITLANINHNNKKHDSTLEVSALISKVEKEHNIPKNLLLSIARVESGISPFALNKEGKAIIVKSKEEALKFVKNSIAEGITNIDIGVMQINYRYHGKSFAGIEDMINPESNVKYAAELLCRLYKKHATWHKAVRHYHSATKVHHEKYSKKILVSWLDV